ncbi:MAG: hypothetical protein GH151_11120 [Bacteroidetes bacterium]|nr:hypothetical protein [Bacteroidota bacterium]
MEELEKLIEMLKSYQAAGLSLEEANKKVYEEHGVVLSPITERLDEKDDLTTLGALIEALGKRDPGSRFKEAIDAFAEDLEQQMKRTHKI